MTALVRDRMILWKYFTGRYLSQDERCRMEALAKKIQKEQDEYERTGKIGWYLKNYAPRLIGG